MRKNELLRLLDEKIDPMLDWVDARSAQSFAKQNIPGKWCNGQHLEHLRKTTRALNKGMKLPKLLLRYKFSINNRAERTYEQTLTKYKTTLIETSAKAPAQYTTEVVTADDKDRVIKWMREEKETMKSIVKKNSEKNLSKYVLPHPLIGRLSFREFVYFTALHTEHHFDIMKKDNS